MKTCGGKRHVKKEDCNDALLSKELQQHLTSHRLLGDAGRDPGSPREHSASDTRLHTPSLWNCKTIWSCCFKPLGLYEAPWESNASTKQTAVYLRCCWDRERGVGCGRRKPWWSAHASHPFTEPAARHFWLLISLPCTLPRKAPMVANITVRILGIIELTSHDDTLAGGTLGKETNVFI